MDCVGLYVDVENLMDVAKEAIIRVFEQWPKELPPSAYVTAIR